MGKDKLSTSRSRLFSPWYAEGKGSSLEFETMDKTMSDTIYSIEKHQLERQRDKEEDELIDDILLSQARNLDLHPTSSVSSEETLSFQLSKEDEAMAIEFFANTTDVYMGTTLAEAIANKEEAVTTSKHDLCSTDSQVALVYTRIGEYLSTYESGRIPKAFKIIPSLSNWDHILLLTNPQSWTLLAMLEATKIFLNLIRANQTKLFFQWVLLPYFKEYIAKTGSFSLEGPLYLALSKGLHTAPALFMKGFLLPMVESNRCTLAESCALANLLTHHRKLPVHPTANALMKLSELPFSYSRLIITSVLLRKRLPLPNRAVDTLVVRFFVKSNLPVQLPHLWYETLYTFVKKDLMAGQKQRLCQWMETVASHPTLTASIQKALTLTESELTYSSDDSSASSDMMSE
ncbi:hypothetical protein INT47_003261 [Mucor saturninus]|uniref:Bystin n=1 Tax=Mucor saturninus TaxID=64648 RepID=A0A8H7V4X0_9FUNG|nr:hypothetical protein INT47_003261 [Mucor saturninus]